MESYMMAIGSDDESVCGWSSLHTPENFPDSVLVEVEGASAKAIELSRLASSSHAYPISLERVAKQGIDFRAKSVAFDVLRGLRPMRLRVWASRWRWLSWNGHLVFALMRVWASLTWSLRRPKKITVVV